MKHLSLWAALLIAAPHHAMVEAATPRCGRPLAGWVGSATTSDPVKNVLALDDHGAIVWNGMKQSKHNATEFLKFAAHLSPKPVLILRYTDRVPCDQVARMRVLINRTYGCASGKVCYEGSAAAR